MILEFYKDYGSACYEILKFLNKKNNSTLIDMQKHLNIEMEFVIQGVSLLLHRNILSFYKLNNKYFYGLKNNNRHFFNIYLSYIKSKYDLNNYKYFFIILLSGHYKLATELDICKDNLVNVLPLLKNHKKSKSNLYVVNFDKLNNCIINQYLLLHMFSYYSKSMFEVYKSILKCQDITASNIVNNLESNQIYLKDDISYINEVSNIDEYLKYLTNAYFLIKEENKYKICNTSLKIKELCNIMKNEKRLINGFFELKSIKDCDLSKIFLIKDLKVKIFKLMDYKIIKIENNDVWRFNKKWNIKFLKVLLTKITNIMNDINQIYEEGVDNEEFIVSTCNLQYLIYLYFIFLN